MVDLQSAAYIITDAAGNMPFASFLLRAMIQLYVGHAMLIDARIDTAREMDD